MDSSYIICDIFHLSKENDVKRIELILSNASQLQGQQVKDVTTTYFFTLHLRAFQSWRTGTSASKWTHRSKFLLLQSVVVTI